MFTCMLLPFQVTTRLTVTNRHWLVSDLKVHNGLEKVRLSKTLFKHTAHFIIIHFIILTEGTGLLNIPNSPHVVYQ